jgi:hypothetical protein
VEHFAGQTHTALSLMALHEEYGFDLQLKLKHGSKKRNSECYHNKLDKIYSIKKARIFEKILPIIITYY